MISKDYLPSPMLWEYISFYRLRHFIINQKVRQSFKPFPPRPEQCLVFYPRGYEITEYTKTGERIVRPRCVISGQFTERINRYVATSEFLMIAVDLKPGALHRLTGIPFIEFTNKSVDAELVFSTEIKNLNRKLSGAACYQEMILLIEEFFIQLLKRVKQQSNAVDHLLENLIHKPVSKKLDSLAKEAFLSPRQLERKFDERVGVSPKTFMKISRFNQSYWMRLKNPGWDWLSIAISCGYADYQHLVKDYKEYANTTPNLFFEEERESPGRILGLTK